MRKKLFMAMVITLSILLAVPTVTAGIQLYPQPRFDEAYMIPLPGDPSIAVTSFQTGAIDMIPDMLVWENIEKLVNEDNVMLSSPGFHFCYLAPNCRSYVPDDYEQPDAGRELAPLNWSSFRQGMAWSGPSREQKEAAILTIYGGPAVTACDTPLPPALGIWHDSSIVAPGGDYAEAWSRMSADGFSVSGGLLIQPNGVAVRDTIDVLSPSSAPTSVSFVQVFVDAWNDFMDNHLSVTNCNFVNDPVTFGALIDAAFYYRNFDVYFLCWGLGRFPDFLYDFFHSSQDYPDGNNSPGVHDEELDGYLEILKYGLVYEEKLAACYAAQARIVNVLCPYYTIYSRTYYNAFKNLEYYTGEPKKLVNMVNMAGYGADNGWTWNLMHWNTSDTGGTLKYANGDVVVSLHPGWTSSAYDWNILNRIFDGLIAIRPDLGDAPSVASYWTTEEFTNPPPVNIPEGTKIRFQIRDGVTWHDGEPVTIEDVQFAFGTSPTSGFIRNFPGFSTVYDYIIWTEIVDPCTIDIYVNQTSQWILYDIAGLALYFPEHMYGEGGWLETNGHDPVNAAVWEIDYTVGNARKALIGCGPYIFDTWNPSENYAHIVKNPDYWIDGPVKQYFNAPQKVDPGEEFEYYIELVNMGSIDETTGELVPAVIDYIDITADGDVIDVITGPITIDPFMYEVLGPYTYTFTEKGSHYLDCHTYAYDQYIDDYEHPILATIKTDVNNDFRVDILDIAKAATSFGSYPGHTRWSSEADVTGDFRCDILDIAAIAIQFGWR